MYLRGNRWSMNRRTRRSSPWLSLFLVIAIGAMIYINQVIVPITPPLFIPTPTPTQSPESFVNKAQEDFRSGKLLSAIDSYQQALLTDPDDVNNFVELARLQIWAGAYDEAIENTQNALLKNPNHPLAHAVQGWALGFQDKYAEAEREIRQALEIDPNNALAHAYYAEILANQISEDYGLIDKAAAESKLAIELAPDLLEVRRARGIVLLSSNNIEEAIVEFNAAIGTNKYIADVHLYLGICYRSQQRYDLAQESLLAAYSLNPQNTVALIELSRAFFADGRFAQASQYAEEAVKIEPENPRLHGYLGITYYRQGMYDKAIPSLSLAVRGGETAEGIQVEGLALTYDDRIMEYYWYYAFALARSNRCSEAIPVFQALLTGVPANEIAVYNATEGLKACEEQVEEP